MQNNAKRPRHALGDSSFPAPGSLMTPPTSGRSVATYRPACCSGTDLEMATEQQRADFTAWLDTVHSV
eukprot:1161840-Pelagomonas_calceolata.AAC.14